MYFPWMGCQSISRLPPSSSILSGFPNNVLVPTQTPGWRGTLRAKCFPKNARSLEPWPVVPSPVQWSIRLLVSLNDYDEVGNDDSINITMLICLIPCMGEDPLHTYQEPWLCQESSSQQQQVPGHCERKNVDIWSIKGQIKLFIQDSS